MKLRTVLRYGIAKAEMILCQKLREVVMKDENDAEYASVKIDG